MDPLGRQDFIEICILNRDRYVMDAMCNVHDCKGFLLPNFQKIQITTRICDTESPNTDTLHTMLISDSKIKYIE